MNIILGASGQVGSAIVDRLLERKAPLRAIVHSPEKARNLQRKGVEAAVADAFDLTALKTAFLGGEAAFVFTPETGHSEDVIGDTEAILANFREAVRSSGIRKIVGLSSIGAQHPVGNLKISYLLERAFRGLDVNCIFIRPAYYYSNWLPYLPAAKENGILPTFYPVDMKIPMISPLDVAAFVSEQLLMTKEESTSIYELQGPCWHSSQDVAEAIGDALGRTVKASEVPRGSWNDHFKKIGFTNDATKNFIEMTDLLRRGEAIPEGGAALQVSMSTGLPGYLRDRASASKR